jgi:hypothetical protein
MSFFTYPTIGGPSFNPNAKPNPNDNWQGVPFAKPFQQYKMGGEDMGDMDPNEPDLPQIVAEPTNPYEMPEMGTPAYDEWISSMGGSGSAPAGSKGMEFDPTNYAHWLRGMGLFAKGALFGAPKQAGPTPEVGKSTVTQENTFDQKNYWDWLFKK